ncbi:MAG: hypothetical protein QNJ54_06580 [Prochloraceae cyanobacterium]|nr:hypothetical protein [Prochloraceae cyanobacterium]
MSWFRNSLVIAFASVVLVFVSTKTVLKADRTSAQDTTPESESPISSRRFKVTVKVSEPEDLKIKEGDRITAGQIIADRQREKTRLNSQRKQLQLTFQRLSTSTITPPTPPLAVPALAALPPFSYLEHEAAIEKSKTAIASIEAEIDLKKQEIQYLSQLPSIDSIILEHERAKLNSLKRNHTAAVRDYQLAVGKLQSAKNTRAYQEYVASVNAARRVEQLNQTRLNYQRQLAEYEQRLADRQYQIAQVQTRLNEVENALASLSVVKAPYAGTVRRVKWLGQSPDGSLSAEVTLIVDRTTVSQQQ